jgi:hypothetical protein
MSLPNALAKIAVFIGLLACTASSGRAQVITYLDLLLFDLSASTSNFASTYPEATLLGNAVGQTSVSADSLQIALTGGEHEIAFRLDSTYDFSQPLTLLARIAATGGSGGQSVGIFFGTQPSIRSTDGITFSSFVPSSSYGAFVSVQDGTNRFYTRGNAPLSGITVTTASTFYFYSLTLAAVEGDESLFYYTTSIDGLTQFSGFGDRASLGSITTFGVRADGENFSVLVDSIAVVSASAVPEPSTYAALAGSVVLGFAAYQRRRKSA